MNPLRHPDIVLCHPELVEGSFLAFRLVPNFIDRTKAETLRALYDDDGLFRSRVVMERHAFGRGEYKYFANPLPAQVQSLREELYRSLVPIANEWMRALGANVSYPATHREFCTRASMPARNGRRHCCSSTVPATSTACIKISTARLRFRFKPRSI